jgi:hypothetical protein
VAGLLLALLVQGLTQVPAAGQAQPATDALGTLSRCVQSEGRLLVLMLIDESGSLKETDRTSQRVTAMKAALRNLAEFGSVERSKGQPPVVEVLLAGFAVGYTPAPGWVRLQRSSVGGLLQAADTFKQRNAGIDTDFHAALSGARDSLASRARELTSGTATKPPCQLLLLFTDGAFDIEPRADAGERKPYSDLPLTEGNVGEVERAGRASLCGPGGIVDDIRRDKVVSVTVGLTGRAGGGDPQFLRAIATGTGGTTTCGRDGSAQTGRFFPVGKLSDLLFAFDQIVNELAGGNAPDEPKRTPVCEEKACPSGRRTFRIEPHLRRFHLLADLGGKGFVLELKPPGSVPKLSLSAANAGTAKAGSASVSYDWPSEQVANVDVQLPRNTSDWVGEWSVTLIDPSGDGGASLARSQIYLYGDLEAQPVGQPVFRTGEDSELRLRVVDREGTPQTPQELRTTVQVEAKVVPAPGQEVPIQLQGPDQDGVYRGTYRAPADFQPSRVDVVAAVTIRTRGGVRLATTEKQFPVDVKPPVTYPDVSPGQLDLPAVEGTEETRAVLSLAPGERGGGCVQFESAFPSFPDEAGRVEAGFGAGSSGRTECIAVGAGGEQIEFHARLANGALGRVKGQVTAYLHSAQENTEVRTKLIPVGFQASKPVHRPEQVVLTILLTAVGVLLPFGFLALRNLFGARFQPTGSLVGAAVPVAVGADGRLRAADGPADQVAGLRPPDFEQFEAVGGSRHRQDRLAWRGLAFRARAPRAVVTMPYGTVEDGQTRAVVASLGTYQPGRRGRRPRAGRVPLELSGSWVFSLDGEPPAAGPEPFRRRGEPARRRVPRAPVREDVATGTLYLLLNEPLPGRERQLADIVREAAGAVPASLPALREAGPPGGAPAATGGGPVGPVPSAPPWTRRRGPADPGPGTPGPGAVPSRRRVRARSPSVSSERSTEQAAPAPGRTGRRERERPRGAGGPERDTTRT